MAKEKLQARVVSKLEVRESLRATLKEVSETCINCKLCQKECAFLRKYGKPKKIADSYDPSDQGHQRMPFECSLCQLCHAVCPVGARPTDMFLQMRCESVDRGNGSFVEHGGLLAYEKRGTSKKYSYYGLPQGCDTVFFPGCTLPGTRPDKTYALYQELKERILSLGVVLDCCTKISHDLGRERFFQAMFEEMKSYLIEKGVRRVLVACPNCHKIFSHYGGELRVKTVYEILAENGAHSGQRLSGVVRVHDPCSFRSEEKVHAALRELVRKKGLEIEEMVHSGKKTLCCGEGGAVGCVATPFSEEWGEIRKTEAEQKRIITCCAGCAGYLNRRTPTSHVLDLLYEPEAALAGKAKVSTAPITYLNRIRLKKRFQQDVKAETIRERSFWAGEAPKKSGKLIRLVIAGLIVAAIVAISVTGATIWTRKP
jgi:Fe-S oxidoreductase